MSEQWRDIEGAPGYMVSNMGRVRSPRRTLPGTNNGSGYVVVNILGRVRLVHRLVADAFLPNPNGHRIVNHLDSTRSNNHVGNLEWCDHRRNLHHAYEAGTKDRLDGENNPHAKLTRAVVEIIRSSRHVPARELARRFGVIPRTIRNVWNGRTWNRDCEVEVMK